MYLLMALLAAVFSAVAQEPHDMSKMAGMNHEGQESQMAMDASGTSRNPASAPMDMLHFSTRGWTLMAHGMAFLTDIQATGPRGADKLAAMSWGMATAEHALGGGTISFRSMLSLDPLTVTGRRYPELFQTGETAYGKPIVDGQHPHDFLMELGVAYTHALGAKTSLELYAAPVGDPAIGPVAFPHRASAEEIPQATITHHLMDSTHLSNEVATAGLTHGIFRVEASGFHGGEPNENRWNIDRGGLDSYSARLSLSPTPNWTGQFSAGRIAQPEKLEPGDQRRLSASVTYNKTYGSGNWATSVMWGRVHKTGDGANLNGYLMETMARFRSRNIVTGRLELADKNELLRSGQSFRVGSYTAGYTRDFDFLPGIRTGLGANLTAYSMPSALHGVYGQHPVTIIVFLRFRLRGAA